MFIHWCPGEFVHIAQKEVPNRQKVCAILLLDFYVFVWYNIYRKRGKML